MAFEGYVSIKIVYIQQQTAVEQVCTPETKY
jgi:hypothetical protein